MREDAVEEALVFDALLDVGVVFVEEVDGEDGGELIVVEFDDISESGFVFLWVLSVVGFLLREVAVGPVVVGWCEYGSDVERLIVGVVFQAFGLFVAE